MNTKNKKIIETKELNDIWDYDLNKKEGLFADQITTGSTKEAWWKCPKGHSWPARIYSVAKGNRCCYCSGQKVLKGFNDLETKFPELAKEWDYSLNKLLPSEVLATSNKDYYWRCSKGHSWPASPRTRLNGHGCRYCSGQAVLKGFNDLETTHPELLDEWNYEKNAILPSEISYGSGKKVFWKCKICGYDEWHIAPSEKTTGSRCPMCSDSQSSLSEQTVFFYIKKAYPSAKKRSKPFGFELDIYIPEIRTAIEYDGAYYHKNRKTGIPDNKKDKKCFDNNIRLIRIREKGLEKTESAINIFRQDNNKEKDLERCIEELFSVLSSQCDVDIKRDKNEIIAQYYVSKKENSLQYRYPQIAEEWDYEKNGKLRPDIVSARAHIDVWWKCPAGHPSYQSSPDARVGGSKCPVCSHQAVLKGVNDLLTLYPEIAKEWDYEKNKDIKPDEVMGKSGLKVWWKCPKGHPSYPAVIYNRTHLKSGCPKCADKERSLTKSRNEIKNGALSLEEAYPELAKEWDYEQNDLLPSELTPGSRRRVWWKCIKYGHSWQKEIVERVNGKSCPICSNRKVLKGFNDLETTHPELLKNWDYEKNTILPSEIVYGSNKKVYWKCTNCEKTWHLSIKVHAKKKKCLNCKIPL